MAVSPDFSHLSGNTGVVVHSWYTLSQTHALFLLQSFGITLKNMYPCIREIKVASKHMYMEELMLQMKYLKYFGVVVH